MQTSRRNFILKSLLTTAGVSAGLESMATLSRSAYMKAAVTPGVFSVNIFSKHLHWLDYDAMASAVAEMGFDGIDLTVRPEGHVVPEKVEGDLPKAVEAAKKAGLKVYMITTAITSADDRFTEPILRTASALGIACYRMGWINYDAQQSMQDNHNRFKREMTKLAALNKNHNIRGDYQNHSGLSFGSPVWDLWMVIKDLDPQWIGSQYDILHATVEGANSWSLGLRLLKSHIRSLDIKDFHWAKKETGWHASLVPLGQGMIDYKKYFKVLLDEQVAGPFSMHFEYPLGGAENGTRKLTLPKEEVLSAMKRDLIQFRTMIAEAGLK